MPRSRQNIFTRAFVVPSLMHAWHKVAGNDGCAGGDGISVQAFQRRVQANVTTLSAAILGGSYAPHDLRLLKVAKKDGGLRPLAIPSVSDRVAQTAAANVLTPVFEPLFNRYSFGYRPGRSVVQAVRVIEGLRQRGFTHVVEADIRRCFENIPHDGLLSTLDATLAGQKGADEMSELVALWLEQAASEMGVPGRGLAQGSPLSPLLANLYLDQLDDEFSRRDLALVRFADDFVILCRSEKAAEKALGRAGRFLREHGLELASDKTRVVDFDRGFAFLGHLFVRSLVMRQEENHAGPGDVDAAFREQARLDVAATQEAEAVEDALTRAEAAGFNPAARVLHIVGAERRLRRRNLSFAVETAEGRELLAIAHAQVDRIELDARSELDMDVIRHALATDTDLALVDGAGGTLGLLVRPPEDRGGLHLAQARTVLDGGQSVCLARNIVNARLRNQRARLSIMNRQPGDVEVMRAITALGREIRKLAGAESVASLRGHEGRAAAIYWPALGRLCAAAGPDFRRSRPALDPLNAAINYLTALLARDIRGAVLARGLHPGFGVLHAVADRHDACVWDMMEGWRALLSEGLAVGLFNQNRLRDEMFAPRSSGDGIRISTPGRRALILGYEAACGRLAKSPFGGRRRKMRALMRDEAGALAQALRAGDAATFHPWVQDY